MASNETPTLTTDEHDNAYDAGDERLDGNQLHCQDGIIRYHYYATEIAERVIVDCEGVEDLGRRLLAGETDAYSLWCAETDCEVWVNP